MSTLKNTAAITPTLDAKAKVIKIQRFQILKPTYQAHASFQHNLINPEIEFYASSDEIFFNYPVILDNAGEPWDIGNLYLINKLNHQLTYNHRTYAGIADHLLHYRRFLDNEGIDYLHFPKLKQSKATYRFKKHIEDEIECGRMTVETGKKRVNAVARFYKDILKFKLIPPSLITESPYEEIVKYIETTTDFGIKKFIQVSSSDLAIKSSKPLPDPDYIFDDGQTKPLSVEDQITMLEVLKGSDRAYQLLIYVALFTGVRLQTAATIRIKDINKQLDHSGNLRLPIGAGTTIDTKNNSRMTIIIPGWLVQDLKVYSECAAATTRRKHSFYGDTDLNYIFLSSKGTPFYTSRLEMRERLTANPNNPNYGLPYAHAEGQAVREFLKTLNDKIRAKHPEYEKFKFHDLRATFGMNLLEEELRKPNRKSITTILEIVQQRMGHRNKNITLQYLNYRSRLEWKNHVQDLFESKLFAYVVRGGAA
ncbi:site-specific integrase [Pseudomonas syringae pv. actinidiae]|nr:site-specific integrase [Pseudomonas syringae pv. actinidiae]